MAKKYDIITIGSATRDVYLQSDDLQVIKSDEFVTGEGVCVSSGSKVTVDEIHFTTGGSAVNAAVTFAQQGFKASILCKVGNDSRGISVKNRLEEIGVDTNHIVQSPDLLTAYSVVVHNPSGERSIFVYRGAASSFGKAEFNFDTLKETDWIFITHMGGNSAEIFEPLLKTANENEVKVALNPGSTQLKMGEDLVPLLQFVNILFVNQEEAAMLTGIDYKKENEVFKKLDEWMGDGLAVMTKGPEGVTVSDGKKQWDAPALKEPVFVDRTGAGDAFASGFTSAIMRNDSVEEAIQLGSANATADLAEWGANRGLLTKKDSSEKFGKLTIKETIFK